MPGAFAAADPVSAAGRPEDFRYNSLIMSCLLHALTCHPRTPDAVVVALEVEIRRTAGGGLDLGYRLHADPTRLLLPEACQRRRIDGLWQHTCCEIFVARPDTPAYLEFNFSPSGEWAAYAFLDYREPDPRPVAGTPPRITMHRTTAEIRLDARIDADLLPPAWRSADLRLGLAAVVESAAGKLSYWALRHPAPRPDFHHRDGFAINSAAHPPEYAT